MIFASPLDTIIDETIDLIGITDFTSLPEESIKIPIVLLQVLDQRRFRPAAGGQPVSLLQQSLHQHRTESAAASGHNDMSPAHLLTYPFFPER
jgi:hypothetical protein